MLITFQIVLTALILWLLCSRIDYVHYRYEKTPVWLDILSTFSALTVIMGIITGIWQL